MSDYNPYTDGPAEPIGLAMDANGNLPPSSLAAMPGSVESVNRQVIENQLLTSLCDKSRVAILATEEDLTMLIICLGFSTGVKAKEMRSDLQQLKSAAFPQNTKLTQVASEILKNLVMANR